MRRKLQDCRKLQELIKSLVKLRELRKSEGEKKGPFFELKNCIVLVLKPLLPDQIFFNKFHMPYVFSLLEIFEEKCVCQS